VPFQISVSLCWTLFGSALSIYIVTWGEVGLETVSVSIVGLHLLMPLSGYLVRHFLVKLLNLLGGLGTFGQLLSLDAR
jgi:hypothetical protein